MNDRHIDKTLVRRRFEKSFRNINNSGVVQSAMASYLVELLTQCHPASSYDNVLEIGCGIRSIARNFFRVMTASHWTANDIVPVEQSFLNCMRELGAKDYRFIHGDMETAPLPENQNLIISNATLQWAADPTSLIQHLVKLLAPGGILAFSTFGPENLREIQQLTGLSLEYLPSSDYPPLLSHLGTMLELEEMRSVMEFDKPIEALRHLKDTGTNALSARTWTKKSMQDFCDRYVARFLDADSGKVTLTYHPVYVIFRKL